MFATFAENLAIADTRPTKRKMGGAERSLPALLIELGGAFDEESLVMSDERTRAPEGEPASSLCAILNP